MSSTVIHQFVRRKLAVLAACLCAAGLQSAFAQSSAEPSAMAHGLFTDVRVFRPVDPARQFVMLVTGNVTPNARESQMLHAMVDAGAMVATVPLAPFYRRLETQDGKCTYAPGAFENLSRHLQAFEHVPGYLLPMLAGADSEGAYVYSVLAQAPAGTFSAGLSLGFCPQLVLKTPPCSINGLSLKRVGASRHVDLAPSPTNTLASPWIAVQDSAPATCTPATARAFVQHVRGAEWITPAATVPAVDAAIAFDQAYRKLAVPHATLGAPPAQLADLPIVEVPATGTGSRFAVLLSGDGGWAGIDKSLGAALAAQGVPVAGFDSLRYFWSARTPDQLAADLDRVIRYYAARWGRSDVLLVGYSQGLQTCCRSHSTGYLEATRASVRFTALLGPGQKASFEFHLANWIGPSGDLPIAPEALKLSAASTLCVYGLEEKDSLCPELAPDHARAMPLVGGHHFGGEYNVLAAHILEAMPR